MGIGDDEARRQAKMLYATYFERGLTKADIKRIHKALSIILEVMEE